MVGRNEKKKKKKKKRKRKNPQRNKEINVLRSGIIKYTCFRIV